MLLSLEAANRISLTPSVRRAIDIDDVAWRGVRCSWAGSFSVHIAYSQRLRLFQKERLVSFRENRKRVARRIGTILEIHRKFEDKSGDFF